MTWLRLSMWSSAVLAILFQAAFLFEIHSPQAVDSVSWSLLAISFVCLIVFVYSVVSISSLKKFKN